MVLEYNAAKHEGETDQLGKLINYIVAHTPKIEGGAMKITSVPVGGETKTALV